MRCSYDGKQGKDVCFAASTQRRLDILDSAIGPAKINLN